MRERFHLELTHWLIIGGAVLVYLIEHVARKHLPALGVARLGLPLPKAELRMTVNAPRPLPDSWFTGFVPLGDETWLLQDDADHWCFGVLTARREEGELVLTMHRRVPFAHVAVIAAIGSLSASRDGDRLVALLTGASYALVLGLQIVRGYQFLGKVVREQESRVKFFAT